MADDPATDPPADDGAGGDAGGDDGPAGDGDATPAPLDPKAAAAAADAISKAEEAASGTKMPTSNGPLEIDAQIIIKSITGVDENAGTVGLQFMLKMVWRDPAFNGPTSGQEVSPASVFNPDIQILNAISTELRNEKVVLYPNNTVIKVKRMFCLLKQKMAYDWFPFDNHVWQFEFNSFTYNNKKLRFKNLQVNISPDVKNGIFNFNKKGAGILEFEYAPPIYHGQKFSTVTVMLAAHRRASYFLSASIVPCFCLMLLAWLSFWLTAESPPARVTIGVIAIVSTLVMRGKIDALLPKISYVTWVGWIVLVTFLFAVASLVIFVVIHQQVVAKNVPDTKNALLDVWARRLFGSAYMCFLLVMFVISMCSPESSMKMLSENMAHPMVVE